MHDLSDYITLSAEVEQALVEQKAIVALESTVIAHGLPYPDNIEVAQQMEQAIRDTGAIPATIGINKGKIIIGLNNDEIEELGTSGDVQKVSRRDLAVTLMSKRQGATTVAGTMLCAHLAGIRFFATGGIGGVHRGGETSMDISADLQELSRTPVLVTCAGAKSILDLGLTLEYLETQGVPVLGWQTDTFPAFYVRDSGYPVSQRLDTVEQISATARIHWDLGLNGLLACCPLATEHEMHSQQLEEAIQEGLAEAERKQIKGAKVTPFLLAHVAQKTQGESVAANKALLINNATWAGRFAGAYYKNAQR